MLGTLQGHFELPTKSKENRELKEYMRELKKQVEKLTAQNYMLQIVIAYYKSRTGITETVLENDDKRMKIASSDVLKKAVDFTAKDLLDCFLGGKKSLFEQFLLYL